MGRKSKFTREMNDRAVRLVLSQESEHNSRWSCVQSIAEKVGFPPQTLSTWIKRYEIDEGLAPGTPSEVLERVQQLERENRELRKANEIMRKAAAFFAQAELDRKPR